MTWIIAALIVWLLAGSLYSFIFHKSYQRSYFSLEIFYTLIVLYLAVMLGFALLYFILSFNGVVLIEGDSLSKVAPLEALAHALYFSGVTLMTVGYGDIIPIGIGRVLALTEALIGYVLPAAFFLKVWQSSVEDKAQQDKEASFKKHHPFT
ncbi:two pore domain potassium channel family protein [Sediminibacillus dalangtanensis]|uniref:Two pore domain potassium channel family protein n=1 Tax=Sediminibacillus dalangtanensis TaxID=2729421 RepID=A0ABX7VNF6_9BACI|nr:potassium channel family protein [Sediminibacillus dalangtanensis]QTM98389.1 two pore domain potassium channel family protein [Sediminibacillus dalangtanensis]